MSILISCLLIVSSLEHLNKVRAYILNDDRITIMCYVVIKTPLLLKNHKFVESSSRKDILCILSLSHGYKPISEMRKREIISRSSIILTSDIDESEKVYEANEVILKKAKFIHQYSEFVSYFNIK